MESGMEKKYTFKKKKFAWEPDSEFLVDLMNSKLGVMAINWVFQGILGADRTEQIFKILFDLVLSLVFTLIFVQWVNVYFALLLAVILAHTSNWLFNGQFWVVGRFCGITNNSKQQILNYLKAVNERIDGKSSLLGAALFGSMARGNDPRCNSDVDLRLIRRKGIRHGFMANFWGFIEKARAFMAGIPLHLFVYDSLDSLDKLRIDEQPYILYDPDDLLKTKFHSRGYRKFANIFD